MAGLVGSISQKSRHKGVAYLFEFLYIYVELVPQFSFGFRKGLDLSI